MALVDPSQNSWERQTPGIIIALLMPSHVGRSKFFASVYPSLPPHSSILPGEFHHAALFVPFSIDFPNQGNHFFVPGIFVQFSLFVFFREINKEPSARKYTPGARNIMSTMLCPISMDKSVYAPMTQSSTPMMPNLVPSSLRGSLPNVSQRELWPIASESSSHRP